MSDAGAAPQLLLLGPVLLQHGGGPLLLPAERRSQLLVVLALRPRQWVERERVAALLWPEHQPALARRNLRKVIFLARELPVADRLEVSEQALRWAAATDFECLQIALHEQRLADAVALMRGPPLAGLEAWGTGAWADWVRDERARLLALWQQAAHALLARTGAADQREALARQMLQADALDETAVRALIEVRRDAGRLVEAQRLYRDHAARLAEELGIEPSRSLSDLMSAPEAELRPAGRAIARSAAPAADAAPGAAGGAPSPAPTAGREADEFVGRRVELQELCRRLAAGERLVSLVGPGGMGKSRLAREAASQLGAAFGGRVHRLELEALLDRTAVLGGLAQLLGVTLGAADGSGAVAQIAAALPGLRTLLVLDNAEHLPDLAGLADALLAAAPALQLLVSSRVRLGSAHEHVLALDSLPLPDDDSRHDEVALSFDAVRLFCLRAAASQRGFDPAAQVPAIVAIVERLGGLPLAIELAAGWVRLLPTEVIAADLAESHAWLERDPGTRVPAARPAHARLHGVLDQSWRLLAAGERDALAALSVFEGGLTRTAALAVARVSMPLLASLADKSLVTATPGGRFVLHPVVAHYAAGRMAESRERAAAMALRHAEHYAAQLGALAGHARGQSRTLLDGVAPDLANARAAWRLALRLRRGDLASQLLPTLRSFFEMSGRYHEGVECLREALTLAPTRRAEALGGDAFVRVRQALSTLLYRCGEVAEAAALAEEGLAEAERQGDRYGTKGLLVCIGMCRWYEARAADALAVFERVRALAEVDDDRYALSIALSNMLHAERALGRYPQALAHGERALALGRELGDTQGTVMRLVNLGDLQRVMHRWQPARALLEAARTQAREAGIKNAAQFAELNLGLIDVATGAHAAARPRLLALAEEARRLRATTLELPAELGVALADIALQALAEVPARLQRVVDIARDKGLRAFPMRALVVYGEWLHARGESALARQVLAVAWRHHDLEQSERDDAAWRLDRIAPGQARDPGGLTAGEALLRLAAQALQPA